MKMVCLDLEGVLVPEIWIAVAETTGIPELRLTTRDISDYDVLMKRRIEILDKHNLTLLDIQNVIGRMEPLPGAAGFLERLRSNTQVIILSDTFEQFASPLMKKLGWPTLFCNTLLVDGGNRVSGYRLRQLDGKMKAVKALRGIGFEILASGDSYNDIAMLETANAGVLFRPPAAIREQYPQFPAVTAYGELEAHVRRFLESCA